MCAYLYSFGLVQSAPVLAFPMFHVARLGSFPGLMEQLSQYEIMDEYIRRTRLFHVRFFRDEPLVLLRFAVVRFVTWLLVYRVDCFVVGEVCIATWPFGEVIFAIWPVSPWLMTVVTGYIICWTFCPLQGSFGMVLSGNTLDTV